MVLNRCIDRIDLPKGIILIGLKHMIICGGNWNEERIRYLLIWLASCVPYLKSFTVKNQTREMPFYSWMDYLKIVCLLNSSKIVLVLKAFYSY